MPERYERQRAEKDGESRPYLREAMDVSAGTGKPYTPCGDSPAAGIRMRIWISDDLPYRLLGCFWRMLGEPSWVSHFRFRQS